MSRLWWCSGVSVYGGGSYGVGDGDDGDGDGDGGDCDGGDDDGGTSHWNAKRCRSDGRGTPFCQRAQLHSSQQGREWWRFHWILKDSFFLLQVPCRQLKLNYIWDFKEIGLFRAFPLKGELSELDLGTLWVGNSVGLLEFHLYWSYQHAGLLSRAYIWAHEARWYQNLQLGSARTL